MSVYLNDDMSDEDVHGVRELGLRIFNEADAEIVRRQRETVQATAEERRAKFRLVTS